MSDKKTELLKLSKAELQAQFKTVTGGEADASLTREKLADAILLAGPASPGATKRQELETLSDEELDQRYLSVFQTKGPEMSREAVIDAIMNYSPAPPAPSFLPEASTPAGTKYKAADGREHLVSSPVGKDQVVIRQVNVQELNGGMVEVPNTESVQIYYKDQYEQFIKEAPGQPSFFSEGKIKVEVLKKA